MSAENKVVKYKDFVLDDFQIRAIESLEKNNSVMVSAATGTGKTLIADYVVNKFAETGKRIIYTAPIKALSNQKYKDFHETYGDHVGMMTGDIVINPDAKLLVMTTEIYRNMLMTRDSSVEDVSYVVFDEIHYINDIERGTVWEESIIFSPENVRFLCLSATVPNAREFADWISSIKDHKVDVVKYDKRAVPLAHYVYDAEVGITTAKEYKELLNIEKYNNPEKKSKKKGRDKKNTFVTKHYHLIKELDNKNLLPCIFFIFSRKACEEKALELRKDFTTPEEKSKIIEVINKHIDRDHFKMESVRTIKQTLPKGVGIHHAGLLPGVKNAVEELFNMGLVKVLYTTETFAVGINMPARSAAFSSLEKYDGVSFRYLNSKEYFQMAGRAGRRGIDKEGTAVAMIDKRYNDFDKIIKLTSEDKEPIKSQYKLSYNSVLNLINNHDDKMIEKILKSSFDYYLRKKTNRNIRIMGSFSNYVRRLKKFGYVDENNNLTEKGQFARFIYSEELLITEIFYTEMMEQLKPHHILALLGVITYEPRRNDRFSKVKMKQEYNEISSIIQDNEFVNKKIDRLSLRKLMPIIYRWAEGAEFSEIMEMSSLHEGDIIRLMRQIVDFIRQIMRATQDSRRRDKLQIAMEMIWRDVIIPGF